MQFCLSQNIIIWKTKNSINTIDLMFMTNRLQICVTHCENRFNLNQFSDHIFVFTIFTLKMKQASITKKRVWKRLNYDKFCAHLLLFVVLSTSRCVNEIENLTQNCRKASQQLFSRSFFWSKHRSEFNFIEIKNARTQYKQSNANNENEQKRIQRIDEKIIYMHRMSRRKSSRRKRNWDSKKSLKFLQISRRFSDDSFVERASKVISSRKFQKCRI